MSSQGYLRYTKLSPNARNVFKRILRMPGKNLCVHGEDVKRLLVYSHTTPRDKKVRISQLIIIWIKKFYVLSIYTKWDGLSQKTISRYCPFKNQQEQNYRFNILDWFLATNNIPNEESSWISFRFRGHDEEECISLSVYGTKRSSRARRRCGRSTEAGGGAAGQSRQTSEWQSGGGRDRDFGKRTVAALLQTSTINMSWLTPEAEFLNIIGRKASFPPC